MFLLTASDIENRIKAQLARELNCRPEDFSRGENLITPAILHEKRRMFSEKQSFLQMVTFGNNAVISADKRILPWLSERAKGQTGFTLFEQPAFFELETELRKYGQKMAPTHHMFVPTPDLIDIETDLSVQWLEQEDLVPWYGREEFPNALCDLFHPERPDVLAVIALDSDRVMGMAGCSADCPEMWQIGIDVLPEYRGRGVGKALVTLLRNEAFRRGAIPYYGTSLSNIPSWKTALSCGFLPSWIEVESHEMT